MFPESIVPWGILGDAVGKDRVNISKANLKKNIPYLRAVMCPKSLIYLLIFKIGHKFIWFKIQ